MFLKERIFCCWKVLAQNAVFGLLLFNEEKIK